MPVLGRTRKDVLSEFRRSELLLAARAVFGKKGFHDASVEEIAEMAEVAKGTVYLYYKSKNELYMAALHFGIESLNRELKQRADQPGGCLETLRALIQTKIVFFEENRDFLRIYFSELGKLSVRRPGVARVGGLYTDQAGVFERVLRDGIKRREVRTLDPGKTAFAIADLTRGIVTQRLMGLSKARLDVDVEFILDVIWKGIRR